MATCFRCGESTSDVPAFQDMGGNTYCRLCLRNKMETKVGKRLMEVAGHSMNKELFETPVPALLIWDGSIASVAHILLCLGAKFAFLNPVNNRRRLPFPFEYLVLSRMGEIYHLDDLTDTRANLEACKIVDNKGDIEMHTLQLEQLINRHAPVSSEKVNIKSILEDFKSESSKEDFTSIVEMIAARLSAKTMSMNMQHILIHDTKSSLSRKLFKMMSLGRGGQIAEEMAFTSAWNGFFIHRAIIDFDDKELQDYLTTFDEYSGLLDPKDNNLISSPRKKISPSSLQREVSDFINNLEKSHGDTSSVLTKIGGKLNGSSTVDNLSPEPCLLCKRNAEKDLDPCEKGWCFGCNNLLLDMNNPQLLLNFASISDGGEFPRN